MIKIQRNRNFVKFGEIIASFIENGIIHSSNGN